MYLFGIWVEGSSKNLTGEESNQLQNAILLSFKFIVY